MSAFICDEKTVLKVVSLFHAVREQKWRGQSYPCKMGPVKLEKQSDLRKLGQALWNMNISAVDQRYEEKNPMPIFGKGANGEGREGPISLLDIGGRNGFVPMAFATLNDKIAALKAVHCLSYQCAEGDVPEGELYQALEQFMLEGADWIVQCMPAYDSAPWGN